MEKFHGVDLKHIKAEDVQTVDEAVYLMGVLSADIADIEGKILEAKSLAASDRVYSDPRWFRTVTYAMKALKRSRSIVQDRRGVLARQDKQSQNLTFCEAFVQAAKVALDVDVFAAIAARARQGNKGWRDAGRSEESPATTSDRIYLRRPTR